jgi:hypothetical protein
MRLSGGGESGGEMTENQINVLHELVGECRHITSEDFPFLCKSCGLSKILWEYSTWDTDADMMLVRRKLREVKKWDKFLNYAADKIAQEPFWQVDLWWSMAIRFIAWLDTDPARFCELAAKFLEEEK